MTYFPSEIVTPPEHLPVAATAAQTTLVRAVVDECERAVLWRAVVSQTRRIVIDGPLPILELEPVNSVVSITMWTETNPAEVIDPASYDLVSRDPDGALISPAPGYDWPAPERSIGSVSRDVSKADGTVTPESAPGAGDAVLTRSRHRFILMLTRAVAFRAGGGGVGDISRSDRWISPCADSYATDSSPPRLPASAKSWNFYRPGIFASKPSSRLRGYSVSAC